MTALSAHILPKIIYARFVTMSGRVFLLPLLAANIITVSQGIFFAIAQLNMPLVILAVANHAKVTSAARVAVNSITSMTAPS